MNLSNLVPGLTPGFWALMAKLGKRPFVRIEPHPERDTCNVNIDWTTVESDTLHMYKWLRERVERWGANDVLTTEALGELAAKGPKLFAASLEQCDSLEYVDLRMPVGSYVQPYPVVLVKLHPEFVARVRVQHPGYSVPDFVLVRWHKDVRVLYLVGVHASGPPSSGDSCLVMVHNDERTMEVSMAKAYDMPDDEAKVMCRLYRVALNSCLLLAHVGCTAAPSNAWHLERCKKKRSPACELEVATHVHNVALDQEVTVRREAVRGEPGDGTHAPPHPHWRRGHWARQRHGEGRQLVKLVFRAPVFVRSDAFGGEMAATSATYRGG